MAAEAGDWRFVAPDNGVLTAVFQETPPKKVVELTERRYARPTVSRTFEGRDRFAPAAAWLAQGRPADGARPRRSPTTSCSTCRSRELDGRVLRGRRRAHRSVRQRRHESRSQVVRAADRRRRRRCSSTVGGHTIARIVSTYSDIAPGEIGALFGSTDHLECAAHAASAAERLGVAVGDPVELRRSLDAEDSHPHDGFRSVRRTPHSRADRPRLGARARSRRASAISIARTGSIRRSCRSMAELGLLGVSVPAEYGGAGMDYLSLGHRERGARVRRHVAARDHVGARRPELPDAAQLGHRGSEAAVPRAAGAGQEDRDLRADRAVGRQRRARHSDRRP